MKNNYWANSNFADKLRGTPKPEYATTEGWDNWHTQAKSKHPFRYWLAEDGLDVLQSILGWPANQLNRLKYWANNRWATRTHTLTSTLPKGQWHEFDTRLLYCMFDELVNFVEIELAWMQIAFNPSAKKQYNAPWYASGNFRWRKWRCPEAGLSYLNWAAGLTYDQTLVDPSDPLYGTPTTQAISAVEIQKLYNWWKNIRPFRIDPYDKSGWLEFWNKFKNKDELNFVYNLTESDPQDLETMLQSIEHIEQQYYDEDTEMMIRLIKIRTDLWT